VSNGRYRSTTEGGVEYIQSKTLGRRPDSHILEAWLLPASQNQGKSTLTGTGSSSSGVWCHKVTSRWVSCPRQVCRTSSDNVFCGTPPATPAISHTRLGISFHCLKAKPVLPQRQKLARHSSGRQMACTSVGEETDCSWSVGSSDVRNAVPGMMVLA